MKHVRNAVAIALLLSGQALAQSSLPDLDLDSPLDAAADDLRGVIQARNQAVIASSLAARVSKLPFREGERFNEGDLLIAFDCSELNAEVAGAQAEAAAVRAEHQSNIELSKYNAVGSLEVRQSKSRAAQATARVEALNARSRHCEIKAPFAGRIVETMINAYETPASNQPLISILDDAALELHVIAPSNWLTWLAPGSVFNFTIDETGQTHSARVERIGAVVDAVSQTIKVIGVFEKRPGAALAGMSGRAVFPMPEG